MGNKKQLQKESNGVYSAMFFLGVMLWLPSFGLISLGYAEDLEAVFLLGIFIFILSGTMITVGYMKYTPIEKELEPLDHLVE